MKKIIIFLLILSTTALGGLAYNYHRLKIGRPGVKYVYERCHVSHGDTLSKNFYTLEFCDSTLTEVFYYSLWYHNCHYYEDHGQFDAENDSVVLGFFTPANYNNRLTEENFKEVSPIDLEGKECRRYAYTNDNGEVLAYIIEGIGIDSRDLGDLALPFCGEHNGYVNGLSYIEEDGQVIYKGMRYRNDIQLGVTDVTAEGRSDGDGRYYNLMGQPVPNPTWGIYIHNGKKVMVR